MCAVTVTDYLSQMSGAQPYEHIHSTKQHSKPLSSEGPKIEQ